MSLCFNEHDVLFPWLPNFQVNALKCTLLWQMFGDVCIKKVLTLTAYPLVECEEFVQLIPQLGHLL